MANETEDQLARLSDRQSAEIKKLREQRDELLVAANNATAHIWGRLSLEDRAAIDLLRAAVARAE